MTKKEKVARTISYGHSTSVVPMQVSEDMLLPELECKYCGHKWIPRTNVPEECPQCKRRDWWKPRLSKIEH